MLSALVQGTWRLADTGWFNPRVVREMIESEFARLSRQGVFSFAGPDKDRP